VNLSADPILTCAEARDFEATFFGGDETKEWTAMQRAGRAVARGVLLDFEEIGGFPAHGRVLVLAGKGHNGGDALIAAAEILARFPGARASVIFAFGQRVLRPLAARAWRDLVHGAGPRVEVLRAGTLDGSAWDVCLDGVFGFQFRPPVPAGVVALLRRVNELPVRLRAAVDLPSGLGENARRDDTVFRADFTYATGIVKDLAVNGLNSDWVGRLRYLDLGFFAREASADARLRILGPRVLAPVGRFRKPESDKRSYGHVHVLGGSRRYPGAVLMTVLAALRSGAGLVTAFVPESLVPAFAARAPEAMWVGWPETDAGGLALEGQRLLQERAAPAAFVIGPGLGREPETLALVTDIVKNAPAPLVIDADALQPEVVRAGKAPRILTPHIGELRRILAGDDFYETDAGRDAVVVVKGRITGVVQGGKTGCYSPFGGPVLARGGSGDLLAGLIGGLLAQTPHELPLAACRGVVWHGLAADLLARTHGQVAVHTTQLLDFLAPALRGLPE
jgi:NAD(P)H-hydrate epimerase